MKTIQFAIALTALISLPLSAQTSLNLAGYTLGGTFTLPFAVPEASAITYNWDRDSFVIVDDEAFDVVEINRFGQQLGRIRISGHPNQPGVNTTDAEAITYLGNNRYMYGLERIRAGFIFETTFPDPVQTIDLAQSTRIDLFGTPDNVGNAGLEGLSYDPTAAVYYGVKEKTPLDVYRFTFDPVTLAVDLTRPFTAAQIAAFGVTDFADIQSLGTVPSFVNTGLADNLLILSQESARLLEVDGNGDLLSSISLQTFTGTKAIEGVTIDLAGNIYLVGEMGPGNSPQTLYVLNPVPEPGTIAFVCVAGLTLLLLRRRTRSQAKA